MVHILLSQSCKLISNTLQAKKKHPFLKRYAGDWATKEYLKQHFANQQGYECCALAKKAERKAQGKRTDEDSMDDWGGYESVAGGSGKRSGDKEGDEVGDEEGDERSDEEIN